MRLRRENSAGSLSVGVEVGIARIGSVSLELIFRVS